MSGNIGSGNTDNRYRRLAAALMATTGLAGALAGLAPLPARADAVIDGTTQTFTTNKNYNDFLFVGLDGTATLNIQSGARVSGWFGTVGFNAGSKGTVNVTGAGSEWNDSNKTYIGYTGRGTLNVTNGGAVTGNTTSYIGYKADGVGTATVTGAGSSWTTYNLTVGERGTGTLTIADGGTVSAVSGSSTVTLGYTASGNGTINIGAAAGSAAKGAGTLDAKEFIFRNGAGTLNFNHTDTDYQFAAGMSGSGTINQIAGVTNLTGDSSGFTGVTTVDGGALNITGKLGGLNGSIGSGAASTGAVTVAGAGSSWANTNQFYVGESGAGALTVADGGTVSAGGGSGTLTLAANAGSTGTLNIGAATSDTAAAAGTLDAANLAFGNGTGTLVFNHTSSNYQFAAGISGNGAINQIAGATSLTGDSSGFTGPVTITGGTLSVNSSIASSSGVTVKNGGTLGGNGTTSGVTVDAGGTLAAGNSIGTLNTGDLSLSGALLTEIDAAGNMDRINVTGTVDLTGGTLDLRGYGDISTLAIATQGTIISNDGADAVTGTFAAGVGLNTDSTLFSTVTTAGGDGNDVDLGVFRTGITLANGATNSETVTFPTGFTGFTFTVNGSDSATFAGSFDESGSAVSVVKTGTGTLAVSGVNTYSGGTTVSNGTLALSGAGTLGATSGALVVSGGTLDLGGTSQSTGGLAMTGGMIRNGTLASSAFGVESGTISAALAGSGALTKSGTGEVVLSGANTYSGDTTVNAGTLSVTGSIDNSGRTTVNDGTLSISGTVSNRYGFVGNDSGSTGVATVDGAGAAWTNSQSLVVGNSGTGILNIANGGAVGSNVGYVGNSSGSEGTVTVDGAGSSWTNSSFLTISEIGAGTLNITNGGAVSNTYGFIGGGNGANGAVAVDGAGSTWTNSQNIIVGSLGTGALTIANGGVVSAGGGSGTVILGRDVDATGTLNIGAAAGDAAMGAGALDAASVAFGDGTGTLVFNHTDTRYEFSAQISGAGNIDHLAGATNLTGVSSGFTGVTTVNGGTLSVNGSIANSATTVNAGGTLGGNGTVGALTVNNGGTLAPGNSIGTLTVNGHLAFNSGSIYNVEVSPTAADRTDVTGSADISGATVAATYETGSYVSRKYTILSASGGLGGTTFVGLTGTAPSGFAQSLVYDGNNAYLLLSLLFPTGLNMNQQSVADTLQDRFDQNGSLPTAFTGLSASDLTTLSGEVSTGAVTAGLDASSQFLNGLTGQGNAGSADGGGLTTVTACTAPEQGVSTGSVDAVFANRWCGWGSAYGEAARVSGNAAVGSANFYGSNWGMTGGFEQQAGDGRVGVALGGGGSSYSLADGRGFGSAGIFNAGLYGSLRSGAAYLSGAAAYTFNSVTTARTVGGNTLTGRYGAHILSARLEAGRTVGLGWTSLTPYAAAQARAYFMPGYSETSTGSTTYALSYGAQTITDVSTELGLKLARTVLLDSGALELNGRVAWAWNPTRTRRVMAAFQALPGSNFSVRGAIADRSAFLVDVGAKMHLARNLSAGLSFNGAFSRDSFAYGGKVKLSAVW